MINEKQITYFQHTMVQNIHDYLKGRDVGGKQPSEEIVAQSEMEAQPDTLLILSLQL